MTNQINNGGTTIEVGGCENCYITENEAVQKLFIFANSILGAIKSTKNDFLLSVFYKNLNGVLYAEQLSELFFKKEVLNKLEDWGDFEIFNPDFCSEFIGKRNLWYSLDINEKSTDCKKLLKFMQRFQDVKIKKPLETLKNKINLLDILCVNKKLKLDFQQLELLELSFVFHVIHGKNKSLSDDSELSIILSLSENQNKKDPICRRYILKTPLQSFLKEDKYLPLINIKERFINEDLRYIAHEYA